MPNWRAVPLTIWSCSPFKSVIALRCCFMSSMNAGVRMKSSRLLRDGVEPVALHLLRVAGRLHHLQQRLGASAGLLQPLGPERGHRGSRVGRRAGRVGRRAGGWLVLGGLLQPLGPERGHRGGRVGRRAGRVGRRAGGWLVLGIGGHLGSSPGLYQLTPDPKAGRNASESTALERLTSGRPPQATNSTAMAIPSPPPTHNVAIPRLPPVRFRPFSSVTRIRAPLQPTGWPSATAPP